MKNNRKRTISVLVLTFCIISFMFSGCSDIQKALGIEEKPIDTEVCVLLCNTKNVLPSGSDVFNEELQAAAEEGCYYSSIVLDGNPKIGYESTMKVGKKITVNTNMEGYVRQNVRASQNVLPAVSEIDIVAGIKAAANKLSASNVNNKKLYIYSAGISTAGALNFQNNPDLIYEDPAEIAQSLRNDIDKIDLSGVEIVWIGLNEVADAQKPLTSFAAKNLEEIWKQILVACNAEEDAISFKVYTRETAELAAEKERNYGLDELMPVSDDISVSSVSFREDFEIDERVKFKDNSDEFVNEEAAKKAIEDFADKIKKYNLVDEKIYILGLSADADNPKNCMSRSQSRADRVKDLLCEYGLEEDNLKAFGIGKYNVGDWRVDDAAAPSEENRKVILFTENSQMCQKFLSDWDEFDTNE